MADNIELKIGHLSKEQADLLPSLAIDDGQVIYHELNGMQFADYLGKRHSYGSVVSGIFNGNEYIDFTSTDFNIILDVIKNTDGITHGQLINVNNSIFMYKKINGNNFIVKLNDTESSVNANTAGYIIHLPEYADGDNVTIDAVISIYDETHGEKVFFIKIVNGALDLNSCQDLDGEFIAGDLGITVVSEGGLTAIVSTLDSNLKVVSYSVDSTGSKINNGFYVAAGDMKLVFKWASNVALPYNVYNSSAVVLDNEIHVIGGTANGAAHYKWNGTSWESVSTVVNSIANGKHCAVVYRGEIHVLSASSHYKWNGTSWESVSTIPYSFLDGTAVVYKDRIHILGGSESNNLHYKWDGFKWISVSRLPFTSIKGQAVIYNNVLHLLGSSTSDGATAHYRWNGRIWENVSMLPHNTAGNVSVVVDKGKLNLLGGQNNPKAHYIFNGTEWVIQDDELPYEFVSGSVVSLDNELHIMGSFYNNDTTNATNYYTLAIAE